MYHQQMHLCYSCEGFLSKTSVIVAIDHCPTLFGCPFRSTFPAQKLQCNPCDPAELSLSNRAVETLFFTLNTKLCDVPMNSQYYHSKLLIIIIKVTRSQLETPFVLLPNTYFKVDVANSMGKLLYN